MHTVQHLHETSNHKATILPSSSLPPRRTQTEEEKNKTVKGLTTPIKRGYKDKLNKKQVRGRKLYDKLRKNWEVTKKSDKKRTRENIRQKKNARDRK